MSERLLGTINLAKFVETEAVYSQFNLFDNYFAWANNYGSFPLKLSRIYTVTPVEDGKRVDIRKGQGPPQRLVANVPLTPSFFYNIGLYDAEGGKESSTLVSNSDERIVRNVFQWYLTFQPDLTGIREIRVFMNVGEASKIFDLDKVDQLIKSGKITSKDSQNVNQPFQVLNNCKVIVHPDVLDRIVHGYLTISPKIRSLIDKLRIKWDTQHKKTVFEIYYSNTLNPLLASLTESLLFKLPKRVAKGINTPWIRWVSSQKEFMSMGSINLKEKRELLAGYSRVQEHIAEPNVLMLSRGRGDIRVKSSLDVSPSFLFGLAHYITEKFSTGTAWELESYADFISTFGNSSDLIINVSVVLLAEEYTVLLKRLTKLFDDQGRLIDIDSRHKELERKLGSYLSHLTGGKVPADRISIHRIPYKEGVALVMFHFPKLFEDLRRLAKQSAEVTEAIDEVVKEKGLGRHAGKASFHMEFKGTLQPLIETLGEKALDDFDKFFRAYVA